MNQVGMITKNNFSVCRSLKYKATAETDNTVDWLVDCGIPARFAINNEKDTDNRMIETTGTDIISGDSKPFPTVVAVAFPARMAPRKTIIPKRPGIRLFLMTFAPYAAEKEGAVPLPPMFTARNIAMTNGIRR